MADESRPSDFVRRLVLPAPRAFVPLLHTNIYAEVFDPPAIFRSIFRPDPAAGTAPASRAATSAPAPAAPPSGAAALASATPALAAAAPASSVAAPVQDVPMPPAPRSPIARLVGALRVVRVVATQHGIRGANDPSLPAASGEEVIQPPQKTPTKVDVVVLIRELYKLGTQHEAEEKYLEFRNSVDNLAKAKFVRHQTLTNQDPVKVKELLAELGESYPWFARTDGWPARPYLLNRQRNQTKRTIAKNSEAATREAKKVLGHRSSTVHKTATPLPLRKTRSMAGLDKV
ncbi:hypothetical protein B0H12DRAFT_1077762 [Mycena haematopus]|nr:hypothetical protein B0H12DRAFT_1077762 [Mycena haematopus]